MLFWKRTLYLFEVVSFALLLLLLNDEPVFYLAPLELIALLFLVLSLAPIPDLCT
jgi:hypothetical protein